MAAIHCVEGLIKYLGGHGNFIVDTPFGLILDAIIRNGGSVTFNVTKQKHNNPVTFQKPLED
jgi:hypothetical protein